MLVTDRPRPHFDSPSVFCRILDKDKGGHFTISPTSDDLCTTKQQYLPASNILQTRYLKEDGVMNLLDCKQNSGIHTRVLLACVEFHRQLILRSLSKTES
jgi:GH15 family glucan-1,4-alpha-glucosidase